MWPFHGPEYAYPGKEVKKWTLPICHGRPRMGCFTAPAGCGPTLKPGARNLFPGFQAPSPAVRKTRCQDHVSGIHLLLQVLMPVTCHLRTDCNRNYSCITQKVSVWSSNCAAGLASWSWVSIWVTLTLQTNTTWSPRALYSQPLLNSNWQAEQWHQFWWFSVNSRTRVVLPPSSKAPNLTAGCRNNVDSGPGDPYSDLGWIENYTVKSRKKKKRERYKLPPSHSPLLPCTSGKSSKNLLLHPHLPSLLPNRTSGTT